MWVKVGSSSHQHCNHTHSQNWQFSFNLTQYVMVVCRAQQWHLCTGVNHKVHCRNIRCPQWEQGNNNRPIHIKVFLKLKFNLSSFMMHYLIVRLYVTKPSSITRSHKKKGWNYFSFIFLLKLYFNPHFLLFRQFVL